MTLQQTLARWIPAVQGQYINVDWNPSNQGFGAQCWDLAAHWSQYLGLPVINTTYKGRWFGWAGNMVDAYPQSPAIAAAYELIPPSQPGAPGDICVWDDSYPAWFPATHVAVLVSDKGSQLVCMSQNSVAAQPNNPYPKWSTGPTTLQHLPRRGLTGFLRPRTGLAPQGTITPSEEELDMAAVDEIYRFTTTLFKQYHEASIAKIYDFTTTLFRQYHEASINETRAALRDAFTAYGKANPGEVDAEQLAVEVAKAFDAILDAGIKAVDVPETITVEPVPEPER